MDLNEGHKVVTRFAPSPTGFLHVGGVRTALFAYLYSKKNKGDFILRIEDTDKKREVAGSVEHIIESLNWLGIVFNKGVGVGGDLPSYKQSDRLDVYKKYAYKLIDAGYAYQDPYNEEELQSLREKAKIEKRPFLFRDHRPEKTDGWQEGKTLRFKTPIKKYTWHDSVRGKLSSGEEALDDFVLIKSDGYPTYNFSHIVDDFEMNVTHVMRADEFISSTPKFLALYEALNIKPPVFVTLPPILGESGGKKLGKRDGAKDVLDYRREGYLPSAIINYLVLQGWNPGGEKEIFLLDELESIFSIEKIQKSGARWNEDKLLWFNREHIKHFYPNKKKVADVKESLAKLDKKVSDYQLEKITNIVFDKVNTLSEIDLTLSCHKYLFSDVSKYEPELLLWKKDLSKENTKIRLGKVLTALNQLSIKDFESEENIKNSLGELIKTEGAGEILWPLRVSLTGEQKSPDPFSVASIIGKDLTIKRIADSINILC